MKAATNRYVPALTNFSAIVGNDWEYRDYGRLTLALPPRFTESLITHYYPSSIVGFTSIVIPETNLS